MSTAPGRIAGALVGALAGVASGMLGIGGGLVVTPVLAMRGVPLRKATGTALGAVLVCAVVAVGTDLVTAPEQLSFGMAIGVALGAQVGVRWGRRLVNAMPDGPLRTAFVVFLVVAACRALMAGIGGVEGGAAGSLEVKTAVESSARLFPSLMLGVGIGLPAGISAVLFGIGGGVIVVPILVWMGVGFAGAAATSLLAVVPTSAAGLWIAAQDGRLERGLLATLLPAAAVGAVAGVLLRNRVLEAPVLQLIFGAFLLYAAGRLWMSRPRTS